MTARIATAIIVLTLVACGHRQQTPVPRPTAYPRVVDPGENYSLADNLPVAFEVNQAARADRPRTDWLDVHYPDWGVTMHVSVTSVVPSEFERVLGNRMQRIRLNLADCQSAEEVEITSQDFTSLLVCSPDSHSTPLQFVAVADSTMIVSGVAFFENVTPQSSVDSLAPVVNYVRRDIEYALERLCRQ